MTRNTIASITLVLAALGLLASPQHFSESGDAAGQRKPLNVARPKPSGGSKIDYSSFSHATKQHQESCKSCHRVPTANSQKVRAFPDVADYPDHDACVRCHRQQFFKSAQPIICSDCHTKISPRDGSTFPFRNPNRPQQFMIEFPHDKHQDVIAKLRLRSPLNNPVSFTRVSLVALAHVADERKKDYNNCTICHAMNMREPATTRDGWVDGFVPKPDSFKTVPNAHSACFNCHWKNQEPTNENCAGCHKLTSPYVTATAPKRTSIKFTHVREQHIQECTACHINITKASSLRGLKPDVPITSCAASSCHNNPAKHEEIINELAQLDKNNQFVCSYCHSSNVGKFDAPASHYLAVERQPLRRKDLK